MEAKIKQILRNSAYTYDESVKQVCDYIRQREDAAYKAGFAAGLRI